MLQSLVILALYALTALAAPEKTEKLGKPGRMMMYACMDATDDVVYDYEAVSDDAGYYNVYCNYPPAIGTITICAANSFGPWTSRFNQTLTQIAEICGNYGDRVAPASDYGKDYANATNYMISTEGLNFTSTLFTAPVSTDKELVKTHYDYYATVFYNWDMPSMFAGLFYCYFIFVFIIVGVMNYFKGLGYHGKLNNKWINWYRKHVSIPALFNGSHTEAPVYWKVFSTLVPTRVESVIVFFFICLNILVATVHYEVSTLYNTNFLQLNILVADRTGLLSFGLIPLLVLFAGRNNILIQLTGMPYSSFMVFHKWVSRLMTLHAVIHSWCWTVYAIVRGYLAYYYTDAYWVWGVVATVLSSLICFQAIHFFRNLNYEVFLAIHIVFASLFMVGCWYHCYDMGYLEWLYASWALWIVDRLFRVIRIFAYGVKTAEVQYISDNTFKMTVPKGHYFNSFPGSFAYIYFMTPYGFWQSHPFTIIDGALNENEITVYIKVKNGMTKYLKNKCIRAGGKETIKVCIEGPYGHRAPTHKYDTAFLLSGGNGIPGAYFHARDIARRDTKQEVKLLWAIRNPEAICWFFDELRALSGTRVQTDIYITGAMAKESGSEKLSGSGSGSSDLEQAISRDYHSCIEALSPFISFHYGQRPDIKELLVSEFTQESQGTVAVMSCGPPKMVDEIRRVFAENLGRCSKRVDLFEELQVW